MSDYTLMDYLGLYDEPRREPVQTEQTKAIALQEKTNPAYAATVVYQDNPVPLSMPRNYRAYVKEAYRGDPTLYKVVKYISGNGAAIPPKLYTDKAMQKEITDHPLLEKLDSPNPEQTGVSYREAVISFLLIAGNSYQYAIRKGIKGPPDELWPLQPDKVEIIPHPNKGIVGYNYTDFTKEQNPILPENMGHLKFWSPDDPVYGCSPIEPIALSIDQQTAARKWNLALLQNYAKSGGTWIAPTVLSPNDYSKTLEKLREIYAGFSNAGKTQLLDGNLQWVNQGMSPTDLDWIPGMQYNEGSIANVYDIAPQLIGNTSSTTYDNMDQAKAASYTESIFPVNDRIYALWNKWLLPMYPDLAKAYLYYDKESIEVLQAIIQAKNSAKIDQATKIFLAGGCDLLTYQQMVGGLVGIKPDPNGRGIYRIGTILITSDKLKDYAEQALTTPAAPPAPVPEPVATNMPPAPGQEPQQGDEHGSTTPPATKPASKPAQPAKPTASNTTGNSGNAQGGKGRVVEGVDAKASNEPISGAPRRLYAKDTKASGDVNYLLWECGTHPCPNCAQNDNVLIAVGDSFPNGCDEPECHKNCQCTLHQLSIPDDVDPSEHSSLRLVALFGVGIIAGSHAGEPNQQDLEEQDDTGDYTDEEDYAKQIHDLAQARARRRRKTEYRAFMEATL